VATFKRNKVFFLQGWFLCTFWDCSISCMVLKDSFCVLHIWTFLLILDIWEPCFPNQISDYWHWCLILLNFFSMELVQKYYIMHLQYVRDWKLSMKPFDTTLFKFILQDYTISMFIVITTPSPSTCTVLGMKGCINLTKSLISLSVSKVYCWKHK